MRLFDKIVRFGKNVGGKIRKWIVGGGMDKAIQRASDIGRAIKPIAGDKGRNIIEKGERALRGAGNAAHEAANGNIRGAVRGGMDVVRGLKS